MNDTIFYAFIGIGLFGIGLYALIVHEHLLRKILAINVMGSAVFLELVAYVPRGVASPDAVPLAMVITGIVVAVAATAFAIVLMLKVAARTGRATLGNASQE